jgi:hypothetical protein
MISEKMIGMTKKNSAVRAMFEEGNAFPRFTAAKTFLTSAWESEHPRARFCKKSHN